jgi:hypothetical protein
MSLTHDNRKAQLGKAPDYDKSAEEAWLPFMLIWLLGSCLPVCQADNEVIKGSFVYVWWKEMIVLEPNTVCCSFMVSV